MAPSARRQDIDRTVMALRLAAMYAVPSRFEDGLAHCMEASVAGAAALRRRGLNARALPCAILGVHFERGVQFAVGLTAEEMYARVDRSAGNVPPLDAWLEEHGSRFPAATGTAFHAVIEASLRGRRAVIDLTAGQLRQSFGVPLPVAIARFGSGWPVVEVDGWRIRYVESPREREVTELGVQYDASGFTDDLDALMDAALDCDLDPGRLHVALGMSQPEIVATVVSRLNRFMEGPPTAPGFNPT